MGDRRTPFGRLGRNVLFGVGSAALSWVVLLAALHAGLRLPLETYLSPVARVASLDYLLGREGLFGPLREGFVASALGLPLAGPSAPQPSGGSASWPGPVSEGAPAQIAQTEGRPARAIVEEPLENDDFSQAYEVQRIPFTGKTETSDAGREPGDPLTCEPLGGTVWFRFRPDRDVGLVASTFGTGYSVGLGVFRGTSPSGLTQIGCDVSPAGNAQVSFKGEKDAIYHFQVSAPTGGGKLVFSLDPLGKTELVSVASDGSSGGNSFTGVASVSADGRYVAFHSYASNLVAGDSNSCENVHEAGHCPDVFVRDLKRDRTMMASVTTEGEQKGDSLLDGGSWNPSISGTGRFVAFVSAAPLVPEDRNEAVDVYVHDRDHDRDGRFDERHPGGRYTERVSVSSAGQEGRPTDAWRSTCQASPSEICWFNDHYGNVAVSISADGRYVAFSSDLHGLVGGARPCTDATQVDTATTADYGPPVGLGGANSGAFGCRHIYVRDRRTDETFLASVSSSGEPAQGDSSSPYISPNGRWVVFSSGASNLAPVEAGGSQRPDANGVRDAFIHDVRSGRTDLVSLSSEEEQGDLHSGGVTLSGHVTVSDNGRWVAFISEATNLSPEDDDPLYDVFLRDRKTGETTLVSEDADAHVTHSSISADGRYVALTATAGEQVESDFHRPQTLLVWDRLTDTGTVVSVATTGEEANGLTSHEPHIAATGRFVVFNSDATNLDARDRESAQDVYIHALPWVR